MASSQRSSKLDRLMIIGMVMLVVWPILYWMFSPAGWGYAIALEAQRQGDFKLAKKRFLEVVEADPLNAGAWFRLGEIAFEEQEFVESLNYSEKALAVARVEQKSIIIDLQANALLADGKGEEAVSAIHQLISFTSLPTDFEALSVGELVSYMDKKSNRRFLNSLAYVMILANVEQDKAQKYISAVIGYFEANKRDSFLTVAYLYERSSAYQKARSFLARTIDKLKEGLPSRIKVDGRIKDLKSQLNSGELSDEEKKVVRLRLRTQESIAGYRKLFLATTRLELLDRKLGIESDRDFVGDLKKFGSDEINHQTSKLQRNDQEFIEYAYELQHYYDTRAMGYFYLGESIVKKSMQKRDNYRVFLQAMNKAEEQYKKALDDIDYSMELKSAMDCYFVARPNNSLVISLPNDGRIANKNTKRTRAVENYHLFLVLMALGNIEEAEKIREKILELGFEPNRLLF